MCDDFDEPEFMDDEGDDFIDEAESDMDELLDEDLSPAEEIMRQPVEDEENRVNFDDAIFFTSMIAGQALDEAEKEESAIKSFRKKAFEMARKKAFKDSIKGV